jgi:hypothetical protein
MPNGRPGFYREDVVSRLFQIQAASLATRPGDIPVFNLDGTCSSFSQYTVQQPPASFELHIEHL